MTVVATVDVALLGSGRAWHVIDRIDANGGTIFKCGRSGSPTVFEQDVDARAVRFAGRPVCMDCHHTASSGLAEEEVEVSATVAPARVKKPVTERQLAVAIARAERAFATQPSRSEVRLTPSIQRRQARLGKNISADLWRLRKVVKVGVDSRDWVDRLVERIESNVEQRNSIRAGR